MPSNTQPFQRLFRAGARTLFAVTVVACVLSAAKAFAQVTPMARLPVYSPADTGEFEFVERPTKDGVAKMRADGRRPLVVDTTLFNEAVAFTNWAENACAVAFEMLPRAHLMHSWKSLGVTMLKTVRFDPEMSADRFRREASFLAFQGGADGIWLPAPEAELPENARKALAEAREDWRILCYMRSLGEAAAKSANGLVRREDRRIKYWIGWMPADWENIDVLRLECVAYAKRLEQILGLPAATLPTVRSAPIKPQAAAFMPYSDWEEKPPQGTMKSFSDTVEFPGGLSFKSTHKEFEISYTKTGGPVIGKWDLPGGLLDFRLYIPSGEPGVFLPYRFHVDMDPHHYGPEPRAPMTGRKYAFVNIDERFRPFHMAYGIPNIRVWTMPRLRDFSSKYPDPAPAFKLTPLPEGGWRVTLTFQWIRFFGHWPMTQQGKSDLWFIGLDRAPDTGRPVAGRVLWPRGNATTFTKLCESMDMNVFADLYRRQLRRTRDVWSTGYEERYYPFVKTAEPTIQRYDPESDNIFNKRLVQPLVDANDNAWQLLETDKNKKPTIMSKPESIRTAIWNNLGNLIYLTDAVGNRRLEYLEGRWRGELPAEYKSKAEARDEKSPTQPDADFDDGAIELDDKEY